MFTLVLLFVSFYEKRKDFFRSEKTFLRILAFIRTLLDVAYNTSITLTLLFIYYSIRPIYLLKSIIFYTISPNLHTNIHAQSDSEQLA